MKQIEGGKKVQGGFYFNTKSWEIAVLNGREAVLPGGADVTYLRVPTLVLLAGAPVFGGLYVMFLPFIGFAMLFTHLGRKAGEVLRDTAEQLVGLEEKVTRKP